MNTIYKYPLDNPYGTRLVLPVGYKFLYVGTQRDEPYAWILHTKETTIVESVLVKAYGTGHDLPEEPGVYIGTAQFRGLVFHFFIEEENS